MIYLPYGIAAAALAGTVYLTVHSVRRDRIPLNMVLKQCLTAVPASAILFLFLQSAAERRIGLDLFLPVAGGVPSPIRILCLCISLLICFAFTMTGIGRKASDALDRFCGRDRGRFAAAAIVSALMFLWANRVACITFMTNDDASVLSTIANIPERGILSAANTFSSVIFCWLLGLLYRIAPDIYWYAGYEIAALFLSCVILGRCILLKTHRRELPARKGLLLHILACCAVFVFSLTNLSFTVVPAFLGASAAALVFCRGDLETRGKRIVSDIATVLLMLFCILQRVSTGTCLLCFFLLASAYHVLKLLLSGRTDKIRRILCFVLTVCIVLGLSYAVRSFKMPDSTASDPEYQEAKKYRVIVTDYLMGTLTDEEFAAAGIPPELAVLLRNWYAMDERLNVETFKKLAEMYYTPVDASDSESLLQSLSGGLEVLKISLSNGPLWYGSVALILLLLLMLIVCLFRYGLSCLPEFLCGLCAFGGYCLLILFLCMRGRFPYRAYLVIAVPAVFLLLLSVLAAPRITPRSDKRWHVIAGRVLLVCFTASSVLLLVSSYRVTEYTDRSTLFSSQWMLEDFAEENSDKEIITNFTSNNLDPFHTGLYPQNMHRWGGSSAFISKDREYAPTFFREDVLFMSGKASTLIGLLYYLTLDYGPVQATYVTLSDNIFVSSISRITPGEDYTGWYEYNGMTYYFENGSAVSGTCSIDGEEYEFAPPGNASMPVFLPGEQVIYTTNAYSLITAS